MALVWVVAQRAGQATALTQQAQQIFHESLIFAGFVIGAGIAYWLEEREPQPIVDVYMDFEPDTSWQCEVHPYGSCYGQAWGCQYSPI